MNMRMFNSLLLGLPFSIGLGTAVVGQSDSSETYVDKVISSHKEEANKQNPFFSYIAFQAIHAPIQAPAKEEKKTLVQLFRIYSPRYSLFLLARNLSSLTSRILAPIRLKVTKPTLTPTNMYMAVNNRQASLVGVKSP